MNTRGNLALAQITLLILGVIAVGWALGSEVKTVSGVEYLVAVGDDSAKYVEYDDPVLKGFLKRIDENSNMPPYVDSSSTNTGVLRAYDSKGNLLKNVKIDTIQLIPSVEAAAPQPPAVTSGVPVDIGGGDYPYKTPITNTIEPLENIGEGGAGTQIRELTLKETIDANMPSILDRNSHSQIPGTVATASSWGPVLSQLGEGLMWSMYVVGAIQIVGNLAGWDSSKTNAASVAAFGGIMAGKLVYGAIQGNFFGTGTWGAETGWFGRQGGLFQGATNAQWAGVGAGIVVGALIFYEMYKTEETETVSFTCEQWQAPTGGSMCEQCNKQSILPCSEYQCRSLGQSCELINKGTTEEQCAWVNRKDVTPPVISLWKDALSKNHKYSPDSRVSPPDTGTKIIYEQSKDGCIKAFTPLEFGVLTNEPASCKLDYQQKPSFDNMTYYFGGTAAFLYNHSQVMSLPGAGNLTGENITLKNNGEYSIFIRCADSNGNKNVANFVFRFCVDKGPDTTPPLIVTTNLLNNMPVAYNQSKLDLEVYTNEPASCRWSHLNQNYEKMEEKMTCSSSILEMNAQMLYKCKTQLNGIKNEMENNFYIRCEDQPLAQESDRNKNKESYTFTVIGTKPLVIEYVKPNGTVRDSTEAVKVTLEAKTLGGYQEGNSICYYNTTGYTEGIMFFNTNSYIHSQDLWLPEGQYTYSIKCVDLGGNSDTKEASFKVETDTQSPVVVRAYNEESNLKIITDEPAECFYGIIDCVYDIKDGIKMSSIDANKTQHYTSWDTSKTFYIKCQDKYGTAPYPNQCSITLRPEQEQIIEED